MCKLYTINIVGNVYLAKNFQNIKSFWTKMKYNKKCSKNKIKQINFEKKLSKKVVSKNQNKKSRKKVGKRKIWQQNF